MIDIKNEPLDLPQLANMLDYISSDTDRGEWVTILMAIKSEFAENGKDTAQNWSSTASNYSTKAFNSTWRSIKAGGGISIGTLVKMAIGNGFKFAPMSKDDKKRLRAEHLARKNNAKLMKKKSGYNA